MLHRKRKGQSLTEFALVLPILLLFIMVVFDTARLVTAYASLSSSVRSALRYGVSLGYTGGDQNYVNCGTMRDIASQVVFANEPTIDIEYQDDRTFAINETCPPGKSLADKDLIENGDILRISADADVQMITPLITVITDSVPINFVGQRTIVIEIILDSTPIFSNTPTPRQDVTNIFVYAVPLRNNNNLALFWDSPQGYMNWNGHVAGPDGDYPDHPDRTGPRMVPNTGTSDLFTDFQVYNDRTVCSSDPLSRDIALVWLPAQVDEDDNGTLIEHTPDAYIIEAIAGNEPAFTQVGLIAGGNFEADPAFPYHPDNSPYGNHLYCDGRPLNSDGTANPISCFNNGTDGEEFWDEYGGEPIRYRVLPIYGGEVGNPAHAPEFTFNCGEQNAPEPPSNFTQWPEQTSCSPAGGADPWVGLQWEQPVDPQTGQPQDVLSYRILVAPVDTPNTRTAIATFDANNVYFQSNNKLGCGNEFDFDGSSTEPPGCFQTDAGQQIWLDSLAGQPLYYYIEARWKDGNVVVPSALQELTPTNPLDACQVSG